MAEKLETKVGGEEGSSEESKVMEQNLASMQQLMSTMMQKVAALESRPTESVAPPVESAEPPTLDMSGLEEMSREQFAQTMLGQFQTGIENVQKRLETRLDQVTNSVNTLDAKGQVREAAGKHDDFWDWKDQMKTLNDRHPTMTAEELYEAARAKDPDRAKELDTKYKPPVERATPSEGGAKEGKASLFGGLTPTAGETSEVSTMKPADAAEKAWQETMAGLGEVLNSG